MSLFTITGAAGFIGSHLADLLLTQGHSVRGIDDLSTGHSENLDPRCQLIVGDVTDPAVVEEAVDGAEGIFHLAAIASVQRANEAWSATSRVNLGGTVNVLETARRMGRIPVVYASSAAVYGDIGPAPALERGTAEPLNAYGADKLASELHARVAYNVHEVPTMGLRFFNVYGARQDPSSAYSGVISLFADRIAHGRPITIHGDGEQTRDFIHVSDVVAHLSASMRHLGRNPGANILNVCTGRSTSVIELARTVGDVVGRSPKLSFGPVRAGDIRNSLGSPASAISMLGIASKISLRDGLAATVGVLTAG